MILDNRISHVEAQVSKLREVAKACTYSLEQLKEVLDILVDKLFGKKGGLMYEAHEKLELLSQAYAALVKDYYQLKSRVEKLEAITDKTIQ